VSLTRKQLGMALAAGLVTAGSIVVVTVGMMMASEPPATQVITESAANLASPPVVPSSSPEPASSSSQSASVPASPSASPSASSSKSKKKTPSKSPSPTPSKTTPPIKAWPSGTKATASSVHASNVVDGVTRHYEAAGAIDGDAATFWNDDTADQQPDTLTITTPAKVTVAGVAVTSHVDGVISEYQVQTWNGSAWTTQGRVSASTAMTRTIAFADPVTTTRVRIVVTGVMNASSRIAEVKPAV
jgi:alpha-L-rhamnosidase